MTRSIGDRLADLDAPINLRNQTEVDAEYAVQVAVKDSGDHVRGWVQRSAAAREQHEHLANVRYGPTLDEYVDIFPAGRADAPTHVFFHGGYWKLLSAKEHSFLAPVGVENGWNTVVVNYSLCPKVHIGEITRQCRAAVAWVHRNVASFGGAADKIMVSGHSAGGHIVGRLLATDWEKEYDLPSSTIAGALPISGLFDLEPIRWSWLQPGLQLSGTDVLEESPIRHLPVSRVMTKVVVGGAETSEFLRQSRIYAQALTDRGLPGDYVEAEGRHHFDVLDDLARSDGPLWKLLASMA